MGALEYPKKNSRNGSKEELYSYFTLTFIDYNLRQELYINMTMRLLYTCTCLFCSVVTVHVLPVSNHVGNPWVVATINVPADVIEVSNLKSVTSGKVGNVSGRK